MEDQGSDFSNKCIVCGRELPPEGCESLECTPMTAADATPVDGCPVCGSAAGPCETPDCNVLLSHQQDTYHCPVCDRDVASGESCDRPDCPRVAAEQIRKASIDTPFKLGL